MQTNSSENGVIELARETGERLRAARRDIGMSQAALSWESGIAQADISCIERGLRNPSARTLGHLASALGRRLVVRFEDIAPAEAVRRSARQSTARAT